MYSGLEGMVKARMKNDLKATNLWGRADEELAGMMEVLAVGL